jgi:hypothetical protein
MATACALEGCDTTVVQHDRGGRPKLYCSDAHRALARRRRLRSERTRGEDLGGRAVEALRHAATLVEEALATAAGQAHLAEIRAQATTQVLEAQRLAADATRELAAARRRFHHEQARLESELVAARERHARDKVTIEELQAALDGARAELEAELLRHHRDVQALEEEHARRRLP